MFLTTGSIGQPHAILGIVNATVKAELAADELDKIADYAALYEQVEEKLADQAAAVGGDGIVEVRFVPEVVQLQISPKFKLLHAYGTAVRLIENND